VVKLCQRAKASCGACCGLYNRREVGRAALRDELERRTRILARAERTADGFREAVRLLEAGAAASIFPSIRVCLLLGYLDAARARIGCLAHPKVNGGQDLRACGVYDVETCESFLCASHAVLAEREAQLVEAVADPLLYGLVATDGPFVRAVLDGVAAPLGRPVEHAWLSERTFATALRRLFELKEELEPGSDGLFGAFRRGAAAVGGPDATHATDDAAEAILAALGGDDRSGNDGERLEAEVRARLRAAVAAARAAVKPRR
jgi:hypothetical protein